MLDTDVRSDRRWSTRYSVAMDAKLRDSSGVSYTGKITEISQDGCGVSISPATELQTDRLYTLTVPNFPSLDAYVIWTSEERSGFAFTQPMDEMVLRRFALKSLHNLLEKMQKQK